MDNTFDSLYYHHGNLGGVDESGVSDIAGPLIAACVVLPHINNKRDDLTIFDVNDSKIVPDRHRKRLAQVIHDVALAIGIGEVSPSEIDYLGKTMSINLAQMRAVEHCKTTCLDQKKFVPDFLLVDGKDQVRFADSGLPQKSIIRGDGKSLSIASASILAKVYRDSIMSDLHNSYPEYQWDKNRGYPCEPQYVGLDRSGIVLGIHRIKVWPFIPNPKKDNMSIVRRRKKWKKVTEKKLQKKS